MNPLESVWRPFPELRKSPSILTNSRTLGRDITKDQRTVLVERFRSRPEAPSDLGAVVASCPAYDAQTILCALEMHLASLDGLGDRLVSANRILVKPNLVEARPPSEHATTNPIFLDAFLTFLRKKAPRAEIVVGEGTGHERDWLYTLSRTGIQPVLDSHSVQFVNLNYDDVRTVTVDQPETMGQIVLPESLCSADLVISCAKLKAHHWAGVTLGMKNLIGCLPGSVYGFPKNRVHWMSIPRVIADLAWTIKPGLTVIDGITAIEGNGPLDGEPRDDGLIIAGTDAFTTDMVATLLMGFSPLLIPQFWYPILSQKATPVLFSDLERLEVPAVEPFTPPPNMLWLADSARKPIDELLPILKQIALESNLGCLSLLMRR